VVDGLTAAGLHDECAWHGSRSRVGERCITASLGRSGGQRLLGSLETEKLRELLWQQAEFSGVAMITFA
jgi:hypothetical protein